MHFCWCSLWHSETQVVVAARHVDADKLNATVAEAGVFDKFFAWFALMLKCHLALAQATFAGKHDGYASGALKRVHAAVVQTMAIRPLVVAWHVDHRLGHAAKHGQGIGVDAVHAFGAAILDVAVIQRERDV